MSLRLAQGAVGEERTKLRLTCTAGAAGILTGVRPLPHANWGAEAKDDAYQTWFAIPQLRRG